MTTSLIIGKSLQEACEAVSERAASMLSDPACDVGFWTEKGRSSVLVGFARRGVGAACFMIPIAEYDPAKLIESMTGPL